MVSALSVNLARRITGDLIELLHQEAPAEEFAQRLAQVELLGDDSVDRAALLGQVRMAMAIRNRLELWQQREAGMLAVIESARDLSGRLDLQELLRAVVSRARKLLGSHVAWLSAYDAELSAFQVLATDGALALGTGTMVSTRERGIVSVVVGTKLPFTTPDYLHDKRFAHDPKLDAAFRDEGVAAVAGVPLLWEGEVIGLLFVADRYHRTHTAQNISILSTLATHAAVAIKNAMAFEQASAAVKSAEGARAELERHAMHVQAAAEAHEQMTSLLARGASLTALCQAVAELMQGSVLVLDEAVQVIGRGNAAGYRGTGALGYAPHDGNSSVLAQALGRSRQIGRSVIAYTVGEESCRANAVIGGNDMLGSVLLFRAGDPGEVAIRTFERSASVIGIVLLSRERMEATKMRDLSALLRSLVSPRQDDLALLRERAERFGIDLSQKTSLMLVDTGAVDAGYAARRLRAANALPDAVFDEMDGVLAFICAATSADAMREAVAGLARHHLDGAYRGVMSRAVSSAAEIPALYAALRRALPVLARLGIGECIVRQNELALYSALFESHDQESLGAFLEAVVGPLVAYDLRRSTELVPTLLCYFDSSQNATVAAQRLGMHVNTIRQRLATIEGLLGHWGNAARALEIHIALRLWTLREGHPHGAGP